MSVQKTYNIGDRVSCIPYQHKGLLGTVRFFGSIGKKFGQWVGLELDEPKGNMSGLMDGEQLFECPENHGLVLRYTQVKLHDGESTPAQAKAPLQISKDEADADGLPDSPLLTPKDASYKDSVRASTAALAQKVNAQLEKKVLEMGDTKPEGPAHNKSLSIGWKAKLEAMKSQKKKDKDAKAAEEEKKTGADDPVRKSFAPSAGIKKDSDGKITVKQDEVKARPGLTISTDLETPSPGAKQPAPASRPSITAKTGISTGSKITGITTPRTAHVRRETMSQKTAEIKLKAEALTEKRNLRATVGKTTPGHTRMNTISGVARPTTPRTGGLTGVASKASPGDKATPPSKSYLTTRSSVASTTGVANKTPLRGVGAGTTATKNTLSSRVGYGQKEETKTATTASTRGNLTSRGTVSSRPSLTTKPTDPKAPTRASSNTRGNISARESSSSRNLALRSSTTVGMSSTAKTLGSTTPTPQTAAPAANSAELKKLQNQLKEKQEMNISLESMNKTLQNQVEDLMSKESNAQEEVARLVKKAAIDKQNARQEIEEQSAKIGPLEKQVLELTGQNKIAEAKLQEALTKRADSQETSETGNEPQATSDPDAVSPVRIAELQAAHDLKIKEMLEESEKQFEELLTLQKDQGEKEDELNAQIEKLNKEIAQVKTLSADKLANLEKELALAKESASTNTEAEKGASPEELNEIKEGLKEEFETERQTLNDQIAKLTQEIEASLEKQETDMNQNKQIGEQEKKHKSEIAELSKQKEENDKAVKDLTKQLEKLQKAKDTESGSLKTKLEKLAADFEDERGRREDEAEIAALELDAARQEKEEMLQKFLDQNKVEEEDPLKELGVEEIKLQNKKLRSAIGSLKMGFEAEQRKLQKQLEDESEKDRIIKSQEDELRKMDFLLDEVTVKEEERAQMEGRLEEIVEYEAMVEEMVQEIADKEEMTEALEDRITELEDEIAPLEELNEQLDAYNTQLGEEVEEKDAEIVNLRETVDQLEGLVIAQDEETQRYKEKVSEMKKQVKQLSEQVTDSVASGESKDQVAVLLEKQQQLISRLRDADVKALATTQNFIEFWQGKMRQEVVEHLLPPTIAEQALIPSLDKVQSLNTLRHKAMVLVREICETQAENACNLYDEAAQSEQFLKTLLRIATLCHYVVELTSTVQFQVANMTPQMYDELTKLLLWDKLPEVSTIIDKISYDLRSEQLNPSFDTAAFLEAVKHLERLHSKTEEVFTAASKEDVMEDEGIARAVGSGNQRRLDLAARCDKLSLRAAALKLAIGVTFVPRLATLADAREVRQHTQKAGAIYGRLLDLVLKIDTIAKPDPGNDILDLDESGADSRLSQKFDNIRALWDGDQQESAKKKDWMSVMEAIERNLTAVVRAGKFKTLVEQYEKKFGYGKVDYNDLYTCDFAAEGPWREVAATVREDLQDMNALKAKNEALRQRQRENLTKFEMMKRSSTEQAVIFKSQEAKLSQALVKAEQVPALQIEKKDLEDKVASVTKRHEAVKQELQATKSSADDLKKKLDDAEKKLSEAPTPEQLAQMAPVGNQASTAAAYRAVKSRPTAGLHSSRQSRTQDFFDNMKKFNPRHATHKRELTKMSFTDIMSKHQVAEDDYMSIITELQGDRLRLRGKDMYERLSRLQRECGAFDLLCREQRGGEKLIKDVSVKLNKDEQATIGDAMTSVDTLKTKVKRRMARARIVDLTKQQDGAAPSAQEVQKRKVEAYNYHVIQTKNKINSALDILFSKDSRLRKLPKEEAIKIPTSQEDLAKKEVTATQSAPEKAELKKNEIKVGEIKLRGKVQIPARKIVLDEPSLVQLRRNLALFQ